MAAKRLLPIWITAVMLTIALADLSAGASSVSDNAYSETVVDEEAGDVLTDDGRVINETEAAENLEAEVSTNEIDGWPEGPAVSAKAAVLMDADTGTLLYAKAADEQLYPASTTKLLTCLLAVENLNLEDDITFSQSAIDAVPADGSNIGMSVGETITVEQCLYGLMVGSGNECANALAEAVAGSIDAFVELMNERAAELGCTNSHFANANGLHDDDHYTTAYDLALIAKAFFENETCRTIGNCASYEFEATETQPDEFTLTNKHELITGETSYSGIIGGKTGYTSQAHENLVTGCEQDGVTLICVVMKEDDPAQFEDTVTLLDYGYDNFSLLSVSDGSVSEAAGISEYLTMGDDLLGSSGPAFTVTDGGSVIVPDGTEISDLTASYSTDNTVTYYYSAASSSSEAPASDESSSDSAASAATDETSGYYVGFAVLEPSALLEGFVASAAAGFADEDEETGGFEWLKSIVSLYISKGVNDAVYVKITPFLLTAALVCAILAAFWSLRAALQAGRESTAARRRRARRSHTSFESYYENRRYDRSYDDYDYDGRDDGYGARYGTGLNYRDDFYGSDVYSGEVYGSDGYGSDGE